MKWLFLAYAVCVVAVSAAPDLLGNLMDPIKEAIEQPAVEQPAADEAAAPSPPETEKLVTSKQGTAADRTKLLSTLFSGYDKRINPDKILLKFGISLINFHVCDKRSVLDSYVWLKYQWEDSRLKWDPTEYGGAEIIRIDAGEVWTPDVTLYNSADPVNMINCWHSNVLIYSTGKMLWVPPCKMTSQCHYTLKKNPYGEQTCNLKFGSWTFDGNVLDLGLYNETAAMDLSDLKNSSGFEVISTSAVRKDTYYSCCVEPYPDITFNMTIKRIPAEELYTNML